jgi:hypothetical protein
VRQIAHKITLLEQGKHVADVVDRQRGY